MKVVHAFIALIRARYATLPKCQKPWAIGLAVLFVVLLILLCIRFFLVIASHQNPVAPTPMMIRQGQQITIPKNSPLRSHMVIKAVGTLTLPHLVSVPGIVEANPYHTVNVLPPLTGRIIELKVSLGDRVKKNQLLVVISSPDLAQAYSDFDSARGVFKLTREALSRAQKVNRAGANSTKDIELAESAHTQAEAELKRTEARLKTLGHNQFSQLTIKSPIDGKITALNYGRGSYVTDLTAPLLTVSNFNSVWVTANIPESLAGVVVKGQRVVVHLAAYPKRILYGKVSFVSSFLDPDTYRNQTRIVFANLDGKLQPNMFATVNISLPQPSHIIIPISAILMNDDTTSVYVESSPWVFERRDVVLGDEDGLNVRVLSGLAIGERVVTAGGIFVND